MAAGMSVRLMVSIYDRFWRFSLIMSSRRTAFHWLTLFFLGAAGCVTSPDHQTHRYEFQRPEMGLPFRIVLYAPDPASATNAAEAAFSRIAELNACLSDYDEQSELSRLSKLSGTANPVPISDDLWRVLKRSTEISRSSHGAFDITVGPLVQLWKRARRQRELPPNNRLAEARARVDWRAIELDRPLPPDHPASSFRHTARLTIPGMRLDPGGIAKGYALGEAAVVLQQHGVNRFLVSGGGDMVAGDPPPNKHGWLVKVGVFDTTNAPQPLYISLKNWSLCTSGDQFQRVEIDGVRYSHIVDPRTGQALTDHSLVTMVGPDPMTTDALSKVVSVLGPIEGIAVLRSYPGVECVVYRQPGPQVEMTSSRGLQRWLVPAPPETSDERSVRESLNPAP